MEGKNSLVLRRITEQNRIYFSYLIVSLASPLILLIPIIWIFMIFKDINRFCTGLLHNCCSLFDFGLGFAELFVKDSRSRLRITMISGVVDSGYRWYTVHMETTLHNLFGESLKLCVIDTESLWLYIKGSRLILNNSKNYLTVMFLYATDNSLCYVSITCRQEAYPISN